eukprot:7385266-Prymnesium_polylepis.2
MRDGTAGGKVCALSDRERGQAVRIRAATTVQRQDGAPSRQRTRDSSKSWSNQRGSGGEHQGCEEKALQQHDGELLRPHTNR